ncbi:50S ribosomal protein L31 [candidate division CPR3 bacterium 4484_211]|uniref:50S ribosomal protein L31 n=1 Tax=candidate division CPR3 bacterium 4484_211 TaxID=1968527 RepID=A0A1W9NY54_UNCC3|nr:MAG: 50S ribosomal protein L31 [candidate division CPR3 bacterium 4484_211]
MYCALFARTKVRYYRRNRELCICACGNTFITGSILKEIKVEICSACHPFFTGIGKLVDTEGRVDRYRRREAMARKAQAEKSSKPSKTRKAKKEKPKAS